MNEPRPVVIYHDPCSDGFTAAWIAHRYLKAPKLFPAKYGQTPYRPTGDDGDVYLVDFSYKLETLKELLDTQVSRSRKIVILDHHEPAALEIAAFLDRPFDPEGDGDTLLDHNDASLRVWFDLTECGSSLTWNYFNPGADLPRLVEYVKDRDLWTRKLRGIDAIATYLESVPRNMRQWETLYRDFEDDDAFQAAMQVGEACLNYKKHFVRLIAEEAVPVRLGDYRGRAVTASCFFSEVAGFLAEQSGVDFGCAYFQRADGQWQYSLRSRESHVQVNRIAGFFGGGGHRNAAGFQTTGCLF